MAKIKAHELREKSKEELMKQLDDLKNELSQLRVAKVSGQGGPSKLAKIKVIRKAIARTLTVYNQNERVSPCISRAINQACKHPPELLFKQSISVIQAIHTIIQSITCKSTSYQFNCSSITWLFSSITSYSSIIENCMYLAPRCTWDVFVVAHHAWRFSLIIPVHFVVFVLLYISYWSADSVTACHISTKHPSHSSLRCVFVQYLIRLIKLLYHAHVGLSYHLPFFSSWYALYIWSITHNVLCIIDWIV